MKKQVLFVISSYEHCVFHLSIDRLALGSDYHLCLTVKYFETRARFENIKLQLMQIWPSKACENFSLDMLDWIDVTYCWEFLIWCKAFEQIITSAEVH